MNNATARLNCSVTGSPWESVCFVDEVSVYNKCRYVSRTHKMKNSYKNISIHKVKKLEWCVQTNENNEGKTVHQFLRPPKTVHQLLRPPKTVHKLWRPPKTVCQLWRPPKTVHQLCDVLCDAPLMTQQLLHVSAPRCHPQGVIITKVHPWVWHLGAETRSSCYVISGVSHSAHIGWYSDCKNSAVWIT
jgi:hypothetical protein